MKTTFDIIGVPYNRYAIQSTAEAWLRVGVVMAILWRKVADHVLFLTIGVGLKSDLKLYDNTDPDELVISETEK
jgi:hypothetical protein